MIHTPICGWYSSIFPLQQGYNELGFCRFFKAEKLYRLLMLLRGKWKLRQEY